MTADIQCERAYDEPSQGYRVLVDRLWPRGIKKENLPLDEWLKDIAPTSDLRKWFKHEVDRWPAFRDAYLKELQPHKTELKALLEKAHDKPLILVFAAKDRDHNNAVVIKELLESL